MSILKSNSADLPEKIKVSWLGHQIHFGVIGFRNDDPDNQYLDSHTGIKCVPLVGYRDSAKKWLDASFRFRHNNDAIAYVANYYKNGEAVYQFNDIIIRDYEEENGTVTYVLEAAYIKMII